MRAVVCRSYGPPENLVIEEVAPLEPGAGQVVVGVQAAGVNFPDTLMIQGRYQTKPPLPFTPGFEVAGVVKKVGAGVTSAKVGDRVTAFVNWGGFAEEVVADASMLVPIPQGMDVTTAAAFLITYGTASYALQDRAHLRPGETLLVLGAAGGVGLAAVELGRLLGARVIAAASSDDKLAICKEHGAHAVINYRNEDLRERLKQLTAGNGVDVACDPVGGPYAEAVLRAMAWGGRFLVIGFAAGEIPRVPLNLTLLKGSAIVGIFWGAFTEREPRRNREIIRELLTWIVAGKVRPLVSATYPLERAADALHAVLRREVKGKIVLLTRP